MIIRTFSLAAMLIAMSTAAQATVYSLSQPTIQQSVPTSNTATGIGATTGGGTWTWDDLSNTVTQTGSNTFTFGPALPGSVGYILNITGMNITGAGATTATSYTCTDGNFATNFIFASICGGYSYNTAGNFTNDSTLSSDACTRTIMPDDFIEAPTLCIDNAFNNSTPGPNNSNTALPYALSVRDTTSTPGMLKVRNAGYIIWGPTSSYGQANAGWEFQFTINGPAADTDGDGVINTSDNCRLLSNLNQADSDSDGFGNRCDGDMNNNNTTNAQDYVLFRQQLGQPSVAPVYNKADINANGVVNAQDYVLFRGLLGSPPGPGAGP